MSIVLQPFPPVQTTGNIKGIFAEAKYELIKGLRVKVKPRDKEIYE